LKENDPKRGHLLTAARALFWKHGIKRVSIEEICREAGISRMTFYKHFHDKDAVIRAILEVQQSEGLEQYRNIMKSGSPFTEKVKDLVRLKTEETELMSNEFLYDLHHHASPSVLQLMEQMRKEGIRIMEKDFILAQKQGHFRPGIHPKFIMYLLDKFIEMAHDEALLGMYPSSKAMILELTNFYCYGILPPEGRDRTTGPEKS
jgi:AcrR family transcriptional regulator